MKKTLTYIELFAFVTAADRYIRATEKDTTLSLSLKNVLKQVKKDGLIEGYQERLNEINLDNCSVDEKSKVILKDDKGGLCFTVAAQKKVNQLAKDLLNETVEVYQRMRPENDALVSTIDDSQKQIFSDLVITKIPDEES